MEYLHSKLVPFCLKVHVLAGTDEPEYSLEGDEECQTRSRPKSDGSIISKLKTGTVTIVPPSLFYLDSMKDKRWLRLINGRTDFIHLYKHEETESLLLSLRGARLLMLAECPINRMRIFYDL